MGVNTVTKNDPWVIPIKAGCEDFRFVFDPDIANANQLWFSVDVPAGSYAGYAISFGTFGGSGERTTWLIDFFNATATTSLSGRRPIGFESTDAAGDLFLKSASVITTRNMLVQFQTDIPSSSTTPVAWRANRGFGLRRLNNVTGLRASSASSTSVALAWTEASQSYLNGVEVSWTLADGTATSHGTGSQPLIVAKGTTTTTITGLTAGTAYAFTVRSVDMGSTNSSRLLSSGASVTVTP